MKEIIFDENGIALIEGRRAGITEPAQPPDIVTVSYADRNTPDDDPAGFLEWVKRTVREEIAKKEPYTGDAYVIGKIYLNDHTRTVYVAVQPFHLPLG